MFTATKWIKGKEETQTDTELLLRLAINQKNYSSSRRPTATYLLSKEDHRAVNKVGDNSPCRRQFTAMCLTRPETGLHFYLMSCRVRSLPTLTVLWGCENGSRNKSTANVLNQLRKDTSTCPPVSSRFFRFFLIFFFFQYFKYSVQKRTGHFPTGLEK